MTSQLSDFCRITMGQSPKGDECNSSEVGSPLLNGPTEFQLIHPLPVQWTTNPKKYSKPGDLLFCVRGSTTGRMNWSDQEYAIGRGLASISPIYENTMHFFRGTVEAHLPSLLAGATGSTFPNVSRGDLESIPVPQPDLSYIKNASAILRALERKIELNQKVNQTLEEIAKAIFKSWFVDFDSVRAKAEGRPTGLPPEISDLFPDEMVDSEIGQIPKGWEIASLESVSGNRSKSVKPDEMASFSSYVGLEHLPRSHIFLSNYGKPTEVESNKTVFERGDILFGKLRPYFEKSVIAPTRGVCSTDIVAIAPKTNTQIFVACLVSQKRFFEFTSQGSTGTRMPRTSWKHMCEFEFSLPPNQLLAHFQAMMSPLVERAMLGVSECETLSKLRDTLLPKLISGELRIPDAEKFLEEVGL